MEPTINKNTKNTAASPSKLVGMSHTEVKRDEAATRKSGSSYKAGQDQPSSSKGVVSNSGSSSKADGIQPSSSKCINPTGCGRDQVLPANKPSSEKAGGSRRGVPKAASSIFASASKDGGLGRSGDKVSDVAGRSKVPFMLRKKAAGILRNYAKDPEKAKNDPSIQEKVTWAKSILPDFVLNLSDKGEATKRNRSMDNTSGNAPKKQRVSANISFAEITKGKRLIAVIDKNDPEGKIPREQWQWVNRAVSGVFLDVIKANPGTPPSCTNAGWYQGIVKVIACDDERTADLYKDAVSRIGEVYPGAKLAVCEMSEIPSRPRARMWVTSAPYDPAGIMEQIKYSNPELQTDNWKVVKCEGAENSRMQVVLVLDKESVAKIEANKCCINYGFNKAKLHIYKKGSTDNPEPLNLEPPNNDELMELDEQEPRDDEMAGYTSSQSDLGLSAMYSEQDLLGEIDDDDEDTTLVEVSHHSNESAADKLTSQ